MTRTSLTIAIALSLPELLVAKDGLGDRLSRAYTKYVEQPITVDAAVAAGFAPLTGTCDPDLGIAYTAGGTVDDDTPATLYYDTAGQLSGVGTDVYSSWSAGSPKQGLVDAKYFEKVDDNRYHIAVAVREDPCNAETTSTYPVGDRLVVKGADVVLPTTEASAIEQGWMKGSCFDGMGTHYFKDLSSTDSSMTWVAENLLPVVVMFDNEGDFNAIFFASTVVQQGLFGPNNWEPVPLPNGQMCGNFCDEDCTFSDTSIWSTMHFYFNDPEAMKCVAEDSSITAGDCTDLSLLGMGMTQCCPTYVASATADSRLAAGCWLCLAKSDEVGTYQSDEV
eukprot:CAMPEP_0182569192 /NCGR_PEP_ID=MMETSP1324-20130603/9898_1 /TAXON_ID=236786 /ORGANISM="Florenciella sp., Strain RCC1587" /LENGTH=334 /DNA_ID=CAMNT_0024783433 /DNA_START=26 /DNA_END=1027 /DNA_ORIENTATION=+